MTSTSVRARAALLAALFLVGCGGEARESRPLPTTLRIAIGKAPMLLFQPASLEFQKIHPEVTFKFYEGLGTPMMTNFIEKLDVDCVAVGRRVKRDEFEAGLKRGKILHMTAAVGDSLVVIVHPSNPMLDIKMEQLKAAFFTGEIRDWATLTGGAKTGPIHVISADLKTSAVADGFGGSVSKGSAWVAGATVLDTPVKIPAAVNADPDALGFAVKKQAEDMSLKIVSVNGVAAVDLNVLSETYPLSRRLYWITDGPPAGLTAEFIKYTLSEPAQKIARSMGFTPLSLEN